MKKHKNQSKKKDKDHFWSKHRTKTIFLIVTLFLLLWSGINIMTLTRQESQTTPQLDTPSQAQVAIIITPAPSVDSATPQKNSNK